MKWFVVLLLLVGPASAIQLKFNDDVEFDFQVEDAESDERMVLALNPFLEPYTDSPSLPPTLFPTPFPTTSYIAPRNVKTVAPSIPRTEFSIPQLNMMDVFDRANQGEKTRVYVLDTGCQRERFAGFNVEFGPSFVDDGDASTDLNGHGTHVAGLVLAVAPRATVVCVKIFDSRGDGRVLFMVQAAKWVARNCPGNCVINLSGGAYDSTVLDAISDRLVSKRGIVFVAASGNYLGDKCSFSPARSQFTLGVSSVDDDFTVSSFASVGSCVDVFAPGDSVPSFGVAPGQFVFKSGTSMSAAYAAGLAALVRTQEPGFHALDIVSFLRENAAHAIKTPPPNTVDVVARWVMPQATHFSVVATQPLTRTWFKSCVGFRAAEWAISFGDARRNDSGITWRGGFLPLEPTPVEVEIVWNDEHAAVYENDEYVFKTTTTKQLWLRSASYENIHSCSRRAVPKFLPCGQRRTCTSPCIRIPNRCIRPIDCRFLGNPVQCRRSAACVWRRDACVRA